MLEPLLPPLPPSNGVWNDPTKIKLLCMDAGWALVSVLASELVSVLASVPPSDLVSVLASVPPSDLVSVPVSAHMCALCSPHCTLVRSDIHIHTCSSKIVTRLFAQHQRRCHQGFCRNRGYHLVVILLMHAPLPQAFFFCLGKSFVLVNPRPVAAGAFLLFDQMRYCCVNVCCQDKYVFVKPASSPQALFLSPTKCILYRICIACCN